jgi:cyclic beta-1,2-glucan synthetase
VIAQAELGHAEQAWAYFQMLSPAHRAASPEQQQRYGLEPYVMAGDVCSAPPYTGRGGWSWYTGSSAWMYRAAVEHLIGLRMEASRFCLRPCLPPAWPGLLLRLALRGRSIEVQLRRSAGADPHSAEAAMDAEREVSAGTWIDFETLPARCRIVVYIGSASA